MRAAVQDRARPSALAVVVLTSAALITACDNGPVPSGHPPPPSCTGVGQHHGAPLVVRLHSQGERTVAATVGQEIEFRLPDWQGQKFNVPSESPALACELRAQHTGSILIAYFLATKAGNVHFWSNLAPPHGAMQIVASVNMHIN